MGTNGTHYTDGTSALTAREEVRLRLVYNASMVTHHKQESQTKQRATNMPLVVALTIVLVIGALSTIVSNMRHSNAQNLISSMPLETVHIVPGDTLWRLAESHEVSGTSTQDVVEWLKVYNDLPSSTLRPGQRLVVPKVQDAPH